MKTVEPLATPEPTTWSESGGDEAITLHLNGATPWWMLGDRNVRVVDNYHDAWWMTGRTLRTGDVVEAMNFLERSKK